jgi:hypothetical protein
MQPRLCKEMSVLSTSIVWNARSRCTAVHEPVTASASGRRADRDPGSHRLDPHDKLTGIRLQTRKVPSTEKKSRKSRRNTSERRPQPPLTAEREILRP